MGNIGSMRRRRHHPTSQPQPQPQPQGTNTNTNYYSFAPPPPNYPNTLLPPYHHYPQSFPPPSLLHHKAITIRNDVNIKKDTLRIHPDHHNPHHFLLTFTFDATAPGCITVMFFAKETLDGKLIAVEKSLVNQISMPFQQGLCQKFRQPSGTGIEMSMLEETGLTKEGDAEVYPLVLKAEARPLNRYENEGNVSSQITLASFEKRQRGEYKVQVVKQVLWVNGKRYELQEIYGNGNVSDGDGHESGGDCVICLSEPRDITVLPCRHMCMCSGCANLLKVHTANCPICRHPVERLLEIEVK
ncbi:probable E3 ubiquitin-protein ligase LOG2 [Cajanus cajan]|uniref:RING-type E3 ubiquitin transferase n=1 Tax=Cajanus cajan TaxID=3821 RepID=A0A151RFW0_CAJCA|nr:probable E3 ubiquitin-protein ligase LOG2 [Cajanus cajan]KYP41481.1 RING finger protein 157 family [Cajanus cajan]